MSEGQVDKSSGNSQENSPPLTPKRGRSQSLAVSELPGFRSVSRNGLTSSHHKNRKQISSIWNEWSQEQSLGSRHSSIDICPEEDMNNKDSTTNKHASTGDGLGTNNGFIPSPNHLSDGSRSPSRRLSLVEGLRNLRPEGSFSRKRSLNKRKAKKSRLIHKDGQCNVYNTNIPRKDWNYIRDIFTTLIDTSWRYILCSLSCVFALSWITFALTYYAICYLHGDIFVGRSGGLNSSVNVPNLTDWEPCIAKIDGFMSAFLFSVETQHTIGYGHRYVTTRCGSAAVAVCLQSLCGLLIQSFMVGLVFAKIARPSKRAATLLFSEKAVISLQNGQLCLIIRVGDMRNTHLVEAHVRLQLIRQQVTNEGEVDPLHQFEMNVGYESGDDRIFLVWPMSICHVINRDSPLWEISQKDLPTAQFEVVVILEGIVESTGMTAQARTSYLPTEILWGHRFDKLVTYQKCNGSYKIDYGLFQGTYSVNTPSCSAKNFDRMRKSGLQAESEYFHKTDTEALLEANNGEEGYTPIPSPIPSITPPTPIKEDNMFNFSTDPAKQHKNSSDSDVELGGASRKSNTLSLLRPPSLVSTTRRPRNAASSNNNNQAATNGPVSGSSNNWINKNSSLSSAENRNKMNNGAIMAPLIFPSSIVDDHDDHGRDHDDHGRDHDDHGRDHNDGGNGHIPNGGSSVLLNPSQRLSKPGVASEDTTSAANHSISPTAEFTTKNFTGDNEHDDREKNNVTAQNSYSPPAAVSSAFRPFLRMDGPPPQIVINSPSSPDIKSATSTSSKYNSNKSVSGRYKSARSVPIRSPSSSLSFYSNSSSPVSDNLPDNQRVSGRERETDESMTEIINQSQTTAATSMSVSNNNNNNNHRSPSTFAVDLTSILMEESEIPSVQC